MSDEDMARISKIRKIFKNAKEYHHEEGNLYTVIWNTEAYAENQISRLRKLDCECHCEDDFDVPSEEQRTMWSVIIK